MRDEEQTKRTPRGSFGAGRFFIRAKLKAAGNSEGKFLKDAAIIAAGGFFAKLIGAVQKVPLVGLIGGYGMGLYQMIYPLFCLILTLASSGVVSAASKVVASDRSAAKTILNGALYAFLPVGMIGSALLAAVSPALSFLQGAPLVGLSAVLAPSVALVTALSVFRGYFQGLGDMRPTAFSEIVEQIFKTAVGVTGAYLFRGRVLLSVGAALFGVTVSEVFALVFVYILYKKQKFHLVPAPIQYKNEAPVYEVKNVLKTQKKQIKKTLYSYSLPLTASAVLPSFAALFSSVVTVRLLSRYEMNAVSMYGLLTGGAVTLANLPVSVCYGLAAASIPAVSAFSADPEQLLARRKKTFFALIATMVLSFSGATALYILSPLAVKMIFPSLPAADKILLVRLIRILSPGVIFMSCTQTLSACLTAKGYPKKAALSMLAAMLVKVALEILLVSSPKFSVYGAAIASDAAYLVAFALNLVYNLRE